MITSPGELVATVHNDGPFRTVTVDQPDPVIWIAVEYMRQIEGGQRSEWGKVEKGHLILTGLNRTVRYRIGDLTPDGRCYVAELVP